MANAVHIMDNVKDSNSSRKKEKSNYRKSAFISSLSYRVLAPDSAFALASPPSHFTLAGRVTAVVFHGHPPVAPLAARPMSDNWMLITVLSIPIHIYGEASDAQLLRHLGKFFPPEKQFVRKKKK
ncbi:hypothetical protein TNCV_1076681 [Trichonephila clavipes]|uniref:Uncharacterized protein n=1 Tax=Trichonephila clavipes TaxID=2585209 RepID=A0A8X6RQQ8_TRICX|nr:hypothetical protein TNCV_1076681 [Trichonephila clavipes]